MKYVITIFFTTSLFLAPAFVQSMEKKDSSAEVSQEEWPYVRAIMTLPNETSTVELQEFITLYTLPYIAYVYDRRDENTFKSLLGADPEEILKGRYKEYLDLIKHQETIIEELDQGLGNIDKTRSDNKRLFKIGSYTLWSGILTLCANRLFPMVSPLMKEFWSKYPTFSLVSCTTGVALSGYGLFTLFTYNNHRRQIDGLLKAKSDLVTLKMLGVFFSEEKDK